VSSGPSTAFALGRTLRRVSHLAASGLDALALTVRHHGHVNSPPLQAVSEKGIREATVGSHAFSMQYTRATGQFVAQHARACDGIWLATRKKSAQPAFYCKVCGMVGRLMSRG
jgi:hypothetical protein